MTLDIDNVLDRIDKDPDICFGKPRVKGTRIKVSFILELLASDWSINDILNEYQHLTHDDIRACLEFSRQIIEN